MSHQHDPYKLFLEQSSPELPYRVDVECLCSFSILLAKVNRAGLLLHPSAYPIISFDGLAAAHFFNDRRDCSLTPRERLVVFPKAEGEGERLRLPGFSVRVRQTRAIRDFGAKRRIPKNSCPKDPLRVRARITLKTAVEHRGDLQKPG